MKYVSLLMLFADAILYALPRIQEDAVIRRIRARDGSEPLRTITLPRG